MVSFWNSILVALIKPNKLNFKGLWKRGEVMCTLLGSDVLLPEPNESRSGNGSEVSSCVFIDIGYIVLCCYGVVGCLDVV
jgi:hypothetical protein